MSQTTINIRIDEKLKKEAEELFAEFGMNTTTAFTIFAKAVVRERKIPFEIKGDDPFYNDNNLHQLMKSIDQLNQGRGTAHDIIEEGDE